MDVQYINPFLTATVEVFKTMADLSVTMGKVHIKDMSKNQDNIYVASATIELTGSTTGQVSLRFSKSMIMTLVGAMTGESPKGLDADCMDALGEVANVVTGNAKKSFPQSGVTISTPKVTQADAMTQGPVLVLPFDCAAGRFLVEVKLVSNRAVAAA